MACLLMGREAPCVWLHALSHGKFCSLLLGPDPCHAWACEALPSQ